MVAEDNEAEEYNQGPSEDCDKGVGCHGCLLSLLLNLLQGRVYLALE